MILNVINLQTLTTKQIFFEEEKKKNKQKTISNYARNVRVLCDIRYGPFLNTILCS
jgi:hypothetical protein